MKVHNVLEEIVAKRVKSLYEHSVEMGLDWLNCSCEHCQLDTACYVLNRMPPQYIISGRGLNHVRRNMSAQFVADIDARILEGMRVVSETKRPGHDHKAETESEPLVGPIFNFPTIVGKILDGATFAPLSEVQVTLKINGIPAIMIDRSWINPYVTKDETHGSYSFWPHPQQAETIGEEKTFHCEIAVTLEGYESASCFFDVPVVSEKEAHYIINPTKSFSVQHLYLFTPSDDE